MYAEIAVNRPLHQTFLYHIPPELAGKLRLGHLVEVSFATALMTGIVVGFSESEPNFQTKPVHRRLDPEPVLTETQLKLAQWIAENTLTPIGLCLWLMLPPGIGGHSEIRYHLRKEDVIGNTPTQKRIITLLKNRGILNSTQLDRIMPKINWQSSMSVLLEDGVVERETRIRPPTVKPKVIKTVRLAIPRAAIQSVAVTLGRESRRATVLEILRVAPDNQLPLAELLEIAECQVQVVRDLAKLKLVEVTADEMVRLLIAPPEAIERMIEFRGARVFLSILEYLAPFKGESVPTTAITNHAPSATLNHLRRLEDYGLVALGEEEVMRDPLQDLHVAKTLPPPLTQGQEKVWQVVREYLHWQGEESSHVFLVHGVTGSGKTEVYMRVVAQTITHGRQAIVLVPEIALTAQLSQRFAARFPGQVSVVHSGLSPGERYDTWRRARAGELPVILGARSALFAPLPDVGLIILDEEHDDSYKQSPPMASPHYHAREVAIEYMRLTGGTVILGSATPDVNSMYRAERGEFELLSLPNRVLAGRKEIEEQTHQLNLPSARYRPTETNDALSADLPPVQIVDMRHELRVGNRTIFSRALQKAMHTTLERGEQAILFLNRRGTSTFVLCRNCGYIAKCPNCEMSLTYHTERQTLLCHYCGYQGANPTLCPECGSDRIRYFGSGTEKIDGLVQQEFPQARVLRWDQDTASQKGAHERILHQFMHREADILVGTQMIAKGLDIPLVTLVGIISADTALGLPDYRTGERTFQLLTQVAGRAGRGLLKGQVILQTYEPDHYAIQAAAEHDYARFYAQEIRFRQTHEYPPFHQLARLLFRDKTLIAAQEMATQVATLLKNHVQAGNFTSTEIVGPTPCFFMRLDNIFRWQVLVRSADVVSFLRGVEIPTQVMIDIHPTDLL